METPKTFSLSIDMLSDWHIGSGAGRPGDVDRLVRRDADGLPYLPGKTLAGILRDGCELVASGLDDGARGAWAGWVDFLFGQQVQEGEVRDLPPAPAALSIRSAHYPASLLAALGSKPALCAAATFVKAGVKIDRRSGRAQDDFLRFEEVARCGSQLSAECEFLTDAVPPAAFALLVAGASMVERVGGKRRRGAGRCTMSISGADASKWISWLSNHVADPGALPQRAPVSAPEVQNARGGEWLSLDFEIEALSPLAIANGTIGNVLESLDFVPGTHLLGAVSRLLRPVADISSAIGGGELLLSDATPVVAGDAGRPVPLAFARLKGEPGLSSGKGVLNRFVDSAPTDSQLAKEAGGWIGATTAGILPAHCPASLGTESHNSVSDDSQRPIGAAGLYTLRSIPSGTKLAGKVLVRKGVVDVLSSADTRWWERLNARISLGTGKKGEYGSASMHVAGAPVATSGAVAGSNDLLTVWLLSDLLVRNDLLRPSSSPLDLARVLGQELGVTLTLAAREPTTVAASATRRESWQARWSLPRPSLAGLRAGTCIAFEVSGKLDPKRLAEVSVAGLGERRAEGFGRIAFDDPLLVESAASRTPGSANPSSAPTSVVAEGDPGFEFARIVELAAWRQVIARKCLEVASSKVGVAEVLGGPLGSSQASVLLSAVSWLDVAPGPLRREAENQFQQWCAHVESKSGSFKVPRQIVALGQSSERVWEVLQAQSWAAEITATTGGESELMDVLWGEAVRALVDACVRARKRGEGAASTRALVSEGSEV
ncbi:MAG: hypothetical protein FD171_864 [Actinobacteria bacterium]|nr:MAG: hypothetical protein FD171_864 [Actinomycetota bacterium]